MKDRWLFRGKRLDTGKWIEGVPIRADGDVLIGEHVPPGGMKYDFCALVAYCHEKGISTLDISDEEREQFKLKLQTKDATQTA